MAKKKTPPPADIPFARHVVTYPRGLNLRTGPGMEYPVLRVLNEGETLQQQAEQTADGWMPVEGGWINSRYVREVQP